MLLNEPGLIGPMRLKNRIIMAPMGTNYGTTDGFATDRDKRYYAERARGGVAMIVTEAMNISPGARNHNNSLCVFHDAFIPGLSAMVEAIKAHDVYTVGQLNHRGQLLRRSVLGMEPVGPTAGTSPATGEPVRALRTRRDSRPRARFPRVSPAAARPPATTRSKSTPPTAICSISSSPRGSISAPMPTAARSRIACGS